MVEYIASQDRCLLNIEANYYNQLDIEAFSQMMKDPSYCYKFYWLEAVVHIISEGKNETTFDEIINEMIANAWYSVREFHIHLSGIQADGLVRDGLERAILQLTELSDLPANASKIEIKNAAGDGFSHSSNGFSYSLYNGAFTQTLNSNIDKKRGMRGNVIFDECGWLSDEMLQTYGAFAIVNKSFKSGKDRDGNSIDINRLRCIPSNIPNQLFYISSASSTDTEFYKLYRDFSKRQLMGDPDYFVAHIDCEVAFKPTIRGQVMEPLLTRSTVEAAMRSNPEKARREYYCEFTSDAGANAIIRRGVIARNEEVRKPILYNNTGKRKIVIAYDPARSRDNSVILIAEVYEDKDQNGDKEYRMRLLNCINLIDISAKRKKPMQTPDQIDYLKELILDYNQGGDDTYSNILGIYIDAGSGVGGVNIADYLMPDWKGKDGKIHRGLIDKEYSEEYIKKFPTSQVFFPIPYFFGVPGARFNFSGARFNFSGFY